MYGAAVAARNTAYDRGWLRQATLPCRVVSVGNLTVGGTGKTACTQLIAERFQRMGRTVVILSRGYGGAQHAYTLRVEAGRLLVDGQEAPRDGLADEPQLLAQALPEVPVLVGAKRAATGAEACQRFQTDTAILDDGLQHRQLRRDCEIILVHARMPLGGWAMFPRGPMREPLSSLKRADIIVVTKADEALELAGAIGERLQSLAPEAVLAMAVHQPSAVREALTGQRHEPKLLQGRRVALLSSIGDPQGFEATVRRLHADVAWHHTFPDHHRFLPSDWQAITARMRGQRLDALVTTDKDWVRLQPAASQAPPAAPLWVLEVRMALLSGEQAFNDRLARVHAG